VYFGQNNQTKNGFLGYESAKVTDFAQKYILCQIKINKIYVEDFQPKQ